MSVPARLALFTALLIAAFGAAAVVGRAVGPERAAGDSGHAAQTAATTATAQRRRWPTALTTTRRR